MIGTKNSNNKFYVLWQLSRYISMFYYLWLRRRKAQKKLTHRQTDGHTSGHRPNQVSESLFRTPINNSSYFSINQISPSKTFFRVIIKGALLPHSSFHPSIMRLILHQPKKSFDGKKVNYNGNPRKSQIRIQPITTGSLLNPPIFRWPHFKGFDNHLSYSVSTWPTLLWSPRHDVDRGLF